MLVVRTYLDRSAIHGFGVFARDDIPAGALIWEFNAALDSVITLDAYRALPEVARLVVRRHAEFFSTEGRFVLSGDNDRFMNHSDEPNTRNEGIRLYAARPIDAGDEITCDYRTVCVLEFALDGGLTCPCT